MASPLASSIDQAFQRARIWKLVLPLQIVAALGAWYVLPGGFPWSHPRFWANTVLPIVVAAVAIAGLVGFRKKSLGLLLPAIIAVPVVLTLGLIVGGLLFPISASRFGLPVVAVAIVFWIAYAFAAPARWLRGSTMPLAVICAAAVGGFLPWSQRAPEPDTSPRNPALPNWHADLDSNASTGLMRVSDAVQVMPSMADVSVKCHPLSIEIHPLLTFESRSPDRCWTNLAPRDARNGNPSLLRGQSLENGVARLKFQGDESSWLRVQADDDAQCVIESFTQLDQPVYSHLNNFTELMIRGHTRLSLSFSPCPGSLIDAEQSDYPVGRPARFAYLDASGIFHVVEASSGEKGPFSSLASGPLKRADELRIGLHDDGKLVAAVIFQDWASQLSTALSPTAGWRVPMNAIEFTRDGKSPRSAVAIWLTLAGTSVGRGWDSVGHTAGTYQNRIRVVAAAAATGSEE